ncbi:LexA family transcriptional regulator [Olleya aquimaris]|uniref:Peptidase S24-like protein n=1 Tax=Olleya aquimaris TaxID=639310 RepID=A0A327RQJ3_9FLAO|nr:LexA family transcriptional regulator [Olleya aquimaris]RAJ17853.1 peptidase S24-like protein [Olleya aquimaris]
MLQIDQKITAIINHFKLNNYAFSKRIGVTGTTIDSIVNGRPQQDGTRKKTKPGYDVLSAIINEFNINPDYLFGKSEVMLKQDFKQIQTYSGIPQVVTVNQDDKENVVFVPVKARAGYLDGYGDTEFIETLPSFNMPHLNNGTYRCFEVQGNSMIRTFFDGDLVFGKYVEDVNDVKDGQVYVIVSKNDGVVLKRVINQIEERRKLILKSDNKDGNYPSYSINAEDIMEIWHVIMFASKQVPEPFDVYDRLHNLESKIEELQEQVKKN